MDLQSFMQSGLLEAYVLGQCTAEERALVERMAAEHPSVVEELAAIEQALEAYAMAYAVAPPPGLKERILDQIDREMTSDTTDKSPAPGASSSSARIYQAIVVALAMLVGYLVYAQSLLNTEKGTMRDQIASLEKQVQDCSKRSEVHEAIAKLLRDPDTKPVQISDSDTTKTSLSTYVYYNPVREETALDLSGVLAPAPGKYLQIWAIVDGKPISLGMVDNQSIGGWQKVAYFKNAQAFAISQEDNPQGNPTPTVVVMIGNVG